MNSLTGLRPAVVRKPRHRRAPRSWRVGMVFLVVADDLQHIDQMRRFRAGVDGRRRVDRGGALDLARGVSQLSSCLYRAAYSAGGRVLRNTRT